MGGQGGWTCWVAMVCGHGGLTWWGDIVGDHAGWTWMVEMVGGHGGWTWWVDKVGLTWWVGINCVQDTLSCYFSCFQALHPRPEQPHPASTLTCFIPKADKGRGHPTGSVVAALVRRAFNARCLFTVTGDQVAWHGAVMWSFPSE